MDGFFEVGAFDLFFGTGAKVGTLISSGMHSTSKLISHTGVGAIVGGVVSAGVNTKLYSALALHGLPSFVSAATVAVTE